MTSPKVPERKRGGLRTGFTTGACAAAAAKAATRVLLRHELLEQIETVLPNRQRVVFPLERCERLPEAALASIINDAVPGVRAVAEVSGGAEENVRLVGTGQ